MVLSIIKKIETVPEDLKPYFASAKGIYIFKNSDPFFWRKIIKYKEDSDSKVMWEIGCDATYPENYENIKKIAKHIDIFSINLTESKHMMGTEDIEEIIKEYQSFQIPLVF